MDPATAIGVAAAVVQFVQFSLSILETCREIRDDTESATRHNRELEEATKWTLQFQNNISSTPASASARRVSAIAKACTKDADELVKLLRHVRDAEGKAKGKQAGAARLLFRAMKEKKTIEKLENRLREQERRLNDVLVQSTSSNVESIRDKLDQLQLSQKNDTKTVIKGMSTMQAELQVSVNTATNDIKAEITTLDRRAQARRSEQQQSDLHQRLLDSLFFPDIDQRRNTIKYPSQGTLDWIYDTQPDPTRPVKANFARWLQVDSSLYWISGKAASGKSTLMAHIVDDERTREGLKEWSQGHRLCLLSFYFWRAGSELQKSTVGLLRSLLYQLCAAFPTVTNVFSWGDLPTFVRGTWTERSLTAAVQTAVKSVTDARFCLFIDGLDEYEGEYDDLLTLVFALQQLDHVKCCISSRPETNIRSRLKDCEQLRLEDCNQADITTFVTEKLEPVDLPAAKDNLDPTEVRIQLVDEIVRHANGIFLWAALVVQSLIKGARSGDELELLYQRLDQTPKELKNLFSRMVEEVEEVHKVSLAFYFQVLKLDVETDISVCLLTAAKMRGQITSYDEFTNACKQTETQILAQSAGLLELHILDDISPGMRHESTSRQNWHACRNRFWVPALAGAESNTEKDLRRERVSSSVPYPEFLAYEAICLQWIHRSAFDYIFPPDSNPSPFASSYFTDERDILSRLEEGMLSYFAIAPSVECEPEYTWTCRPWPYSWRHTSTGYRMLELAYIVSQEMKRDDSCADDLIDQLGTLVYRMDSPEFRGCYLMNLYEVWDINFNGEAAFFDFCVENELYDRALLLVNEAISRDDGNTTLVPYLVYLLNSVSDFKFPSTSHMISMQNLVKGIRGNFDLGEQGRKSKIQDKRKVFIFTSEVDYSHGLFPKSVSCVSLNRRTRSLEARYESGICILLAHVVRLWLKIVSYWTQRDTKLENTGGIQQQEILTTTTDSRTTITNDLRPILAGLDMAMELQFIRPPRNRKRLMLQVSYDLWLDRMNFTTLSKATSFRRNNETSPALRLVCQLRDITKGRFVEVQDSICFIPRENTAHALVKHIAYCAIDGSQPQIYGTQNQRLKWRRMVLEDVWANEQGLSATEQLFVLAFVRTQLLDWFGELPSDADVDDDENYIVCQCENGFYAIRRPGDFADPEKI